MDLMQIFDLIMKVEIGALLNQYGMYVYAVLFLIIFSETGLVVLFFFPGDTLLFIAGAACSAGQMNYWFLVALLITAAVLGNTLNYHIGSRIAGHSGYGSVAPSNVTSSNTSGISTTATMNV